MPLNKMAIFVEGYTEVLFIDKLLQEVANANQVVIEKRKIRGGTTTRRTSRLIEAVTPHTNQEHFVLIYDCGNDEQVKSRMREEYDRLTQSGFTRIVCVRDVFPDFTAADIPNLINGLPKYVKTQPVTVDFILSVMEIEAWFLAEHTHMTRIDESLTAELIEDKLGFHPERDDLMLRDKPAQDLFACYQLAGKTYAKGDIATIRTLDYAEIYTNVRNRFPHLDSLCCIIDGFLST